MQLLIGLLISIALGYQAKQKGRDGLKFGAGVGTALLVPLAAIQFWDQAVGAHPALWWVIAALVTYIAWARLNNVKAPYEHNAAIFQKVSELQVQENQVKDGQTAESSPDQKVTTKVRVLLAGLQPGREPTEAHLKLAALFKTDVEQVLVMLNQTPYSLKSGLDDRVAQKYRSAIELAGGTCVVEVERTVNEVLEVDLPPMSAATTDKQIAKNSFTDNPAQKLAKAGIMNTNVRNRRGIFIGAIVVLFILIFGAENFHEWKSSASGSPLVSKSLGNDNDSAIAISPIATFDATKLSDALNTQFPEAMPIASWAHQGYGLSQRTRIFFLTDALQKISKVSIEQLGVRTTTGEVHEVPRYALRYVLDVAKRNDSLELVSFYGSANPVRISFDASNQYLEVMPNNGDQIAERLSGLLAEGIKSAASIKIHHGASASGGELAFQYDLVEVRKAIGLALAALNSAPSSKQESDLSSSSVPEVNRQNGKMGLESSSNDNRQALQKYRYMVPVVLRGRLTTRLGYPANGDNFYYQHLTLETPITVQEIPNDPDSPAESNVLNLQVLFPDHLRGVIKSLEGTQVTLEGNLWHASTGNHLTPVLMSISRIVK